MIQFSKTYIFSMIQYRVSTVGTKLYLSFRNYGARFYSLF